MKTLRTMLKRAEGGFLAFQSLDLRRKPVEILMAYRKILYQETTSKSTTRWLRTPARKLAYQDRALASRTSGVHPIKVSYFLARWKDNEYLLVVNTDINILLRLSLISKKLLFVRVVKRSMYNHWIPPNHFVLNAKYHVSDSLTSTSSFLTNSPWFRSLPVKLRKSEESDIFGIISTYFINNEAVVIRRKSAEFHVCISQYKYLRRNRW